MAVKKTKKISKKSKLSAGQAKDKIIKKPTEKVGRFFKAIGRRKTAIAQVRLYQKAGKEFSVNNKPLNEYFSSLESQQIAVSPLEKTDFLGKFTVSVKVSGGGLHAQGEAIRHGVSRALTKFNPELHKKLKKAGFLTRDSRMRERKKPGLKRARRAPQWSKR